MRDGIVVTTLFVVCCDPNSRIIAAPHIAATGRTTAIHIRIQTMRAATVAGMLQVSYVNLWMRVKAITGHEYQGDII
jgi:hypothetical protein